MPLISENVDPMCLPEANPEADFGQIGFEDNFRMHLRGEMLTESKSGPTSGSN